MNQTTPAIDHGTEQPAGPHLHRWSTVRAVGLAIAAFGVSFAADEAMLGAATATQQIRVIVGAALLALGAVIAAVGHLGHIQRPTATAGDRRASGRVLLVAATALAVARGGAQVADLIDHVGADLDEPTTTLVHLARIGLTAGLAGALAALASHELRS